ncbi:ALG6, ALG8 glycosyltransferase [Ramicandelaber brevisporus]|nr:ALG6, ALG8 glycosyltransferase [Ramicandelaber brevisporus]
MLGYAASLLTVGLAVKLLLIPSYRSTDFEVHRNWLAITHSLPLREWYTNDLSIWTLDYPPFFAWFEYALSHAARFFDPEMLVVKNLEHASSATILFQRLSVMATEMLLWYAVTSRLSERLCKGSVASKMAAAMIFLSPGFMYVDHVHFQYNGFLFGIFVLTMLDILEGNDLRAGILFAILLNFKHIFVYLAPAYFAYLLRHYCMPSSLPSKKTATGNEKNTTGASIVTLITSLDILRLIKLGGAVIAVVAVSLGPWVYMNQLPQLASRLFPFKRGLCHAYWAPNAWALYSFADRALLAVTKLPVIKTLPVVQQLLANSNASNMASATRGIVGDSSFVILPDVPPSTTFIVSAVLMLPTMWSVFYRRATPLQFVKAVTLCALTSFMFGWHVHEKAILLAIIPLTIVALLAPSPQHNAVFLILSAAGYYSLFPLLFDITEAPAKLAIYTLWALLSVAFCAANWYVTSISRYFPFLGDLHLLERVYLAGFLLLQLYTGILHHAVFGNRDSVSFLPLMATSVYCAAGVSWVWLKCHFMWLF